MSFKFIGAKYLIGGPPIMIALVMAIILTGLGGVVPAQEMKDQKPKKPRFEKTDLTLKDNKTGLVWTLNGNLAEHPYSWNGANDYIEKLNRDRYAGFHNWKLPSQEDFLALIEHVRSLGYDGSGQERTVAAGLAGLGFQQVQDGGYWSSTEYLYFEAEAWFVDMMTGSASRGEKSLYYSIWPVRSAR